MDSSTLSVVVPQTTLKSSNFATAQRVIRSAQEQVSSLRGRIGAFQKDTLQTTVNFLACGFGKHCGCRECYSRN